MDRIPSARGAPEVSEFQRHIFEVQAGRKASVAT